MQKILLVDDEANIRDLNAMYLEKEGFSVEHAVNGNEAISKFEQAQPQLVVLDVMMPGMDGFEVCRELRRESDVPILMLTARNRPEDVLRGFESGADDYLAKPFELSILIARLHGLLRRSEWAKRKHAPQTTGEICTFAGKTIDFSALELKVGEKTVRLTLMEADLLRYLLQHEGQSVSRKAMLEAVWGLHEDTDTRAIDNFIVRLRKYLEDDPANPQHLLTVRGVGYRFLMTPAN